MKTPEQRAERLARTMGRGPRNASVQDDIARAIRAAENAAYERAAKALDEGDFKPGDEGRIVRSLKSRAPRGRA